MRTSDFTTKPSSKVMNETLNKKFGEKLDIDNYSNTQLEKAASLIESRIAVLKKGKFNETLESEEFHRLKLMQDIVKTAITERAKKAKPDYLDFDKDGNKKEPMKKALKDKKTNEAAKPDFLDLDKDGNKKEPMKKAAKDKKMDEVSNELKRRAVDAGLKKAADAKKAGWNKKGDEKKGKKADASRDTFRKKTDQAGRIVMKMKESYERLYEGEESKAELIMAVKDMVDKFTGWSEDIAQMQAQTAMEMADAIRDELGADQAEAFTASVQPALDAAFQSVKSAREALNNSVASLTGVAPTPMGAEPGMDDMGDMDAGMDAGMDDMGGDLDAEMPTDDAEMDMDMAAPVDRAKRESIEHRLRLTKILVGR